MAAYIKSDRLCEVHFSSERDHTTYGRIYIGKIVSISENLKAAFVDIGVGINGYLPLTELKFARFTKKYGKKPISAGDELLVQVTREAVKSKGPTLTTSLSISGTYVVLSTGKYEVKCSAKLSKEQRDAVLQAFTNWQESRNAAMQDALPLPDQIQQTASQEADGASQAARPHLYRVMLRTNCGYVEDPSCIFAEYEKLSTQLTSIVQKAPYMTCCSCVYAPDNGVLTVLNRLPHASYEEIVTDDPSELSLLSDNTTVPVRLYADKTLPLAKLYNLDRQLEQALQRQVWMKSGAYLVIEPTEALVSIDVNTGKCEQGKNREEIFFKINLEAAEEIARQLRLRRLSGMILIDFINMKDAEHKRALMEGLRRAFLGDPLHPVVVDMTKLGLVEVTRRKDESTLRAALQMR